MALNFPGPYSIRLFYTTTPTGFQPATHKLELNCDVVGTPEVGGDFADIQLSLRGGGTQAANVAILAFVTLIKPLFSTTTDFTIAEMWKYEPNSFDATFIAALPIAEVGTGGAPTAAMAASQVICTFRSAEGGIAKFALMESQIAPALRLSYPTGNTTINAVMAYVAGPTTWVLARDTSYVRVPLNCLPGQSEALFKKRFR